MFCGEREQSKKICVLSSSVVRQICKYVTKLSSHGIWAESWPSMNYMFSERMWHDWVESKNSCSFISYINEEVWSLLLLKQRVDVLHGGKAHFDVFQGSRAVMGWCYQRTQDEAADLFFSNSQCEAILSFIDV